jgi:glycosyltransferase involved in cell wall biosynthesis
VSIVTSCFQGEPYLEGYFEAVLSQTALEQVEVVLVQNDPSSDELAVVERVISQHPGLVRHIVVPREHASRSMNRAVSAATGQYVALWNVDDVRTTDSIERQAGALDQHPNALLAFGDMVIVPQYGDVDGVLVTEPEFERSLFMRSCFGGTFPMWRREAFDIVGLFDEQLRSGWDFDQLVRCAATGRVIKVRGVLGYFLNAGLGLSTAGDGLQPIERTVIELRYGILDKVDRRYLAAASRYRVGELLVGDQWIPVGRYVSELDGILARAAEDPRIQPKTGAYDWAAERLKNLLYRLRVVQHRDGRSS